MVATGPHSMVAVNLTDPLAGTRRLGSLHALLVSVPGPAGSWHGLPAVVGRDPDASEGFYRGTSRRCRPAIISDIVKVEYDDEQ